MKIIVYTGLQSQTQLLHGADNTKGFSTRPFTIFYLFLNTICVDY